MPYDTVKVCVKVKGLWGSGPGKFSSSVNGQRDTAGDWYTKCPWDGPGSCLLATGELWTLIDPPRRGPEVLMAPLES